MHLGFADIGFVADIGFFADRAFANAGDCSLGAGAQHFSTYERRPACESLRAQASQSIASRAVGRSRFSLIRSGRCEISLDATVGVDA